MGDDNGRTSNKPNAAPLPTLPYHRPESRKRRPVPGALAILAAAVCFFVGLSFGVQSVSMLANGNFLAGGMGGLFSVAFILASATLVKTATMLIRGTRPGGDGETVV